MTPKSSAERRRRSATNLAALAALAWLPACAAGGVAPSPGGGGSATVSEAAVDSELRVGELSPRSLAAGECGLFLWRRTQDPPLVFFYNSSTGRAAISIDGEELALQRVQVTSSPAGARYGEQLFATQDGEFTVRVAIHEREDLPDGARIGRAVVRAADDRGWSVVIGAGGLAACQS